MTLCIAGLCRFNQLQPRARAFVLCADGRLDAGTFGASDVAYKFHDLGYNSLALIASEDWDGAMELCHTLQQKQTAMGAPTSRNAFISRLRTETTAFLGSYEIEDTALLVSGFIDYDPILTYVYVTENRPTVKALHVIECIGSGAEAASALLKHRAYDDLNFTIHKAIYAIYEAKKFSEVLTGVGPQTRMKIHLPMEKPEPNDYSIRDVQPKEFGRLEACRQKYFLQPITDIVPAVLDFTRVKQSTPTVPKRDR